MIPLTGEFTYSSTHYRKKL